MNSSVSTVKLHSNRYLSLTSLFLWFRDEIQMKTYSRTNGQPKPSSTPSPPSHPVSVSTRPGQAYSSAGSSQSPAHKPGGGVKKVTGVGGTTYEISVWETLFWPVLSRMEPWTHFLHRHRRGSSVWWTFIGAYRKDLKTSDLCCYFLKRKWCWAAGFGLDMTEEEEEGVIQAVTPWDFRTPRH